MRKLFTLAAILTSLLLTGCACIGDAVDSIDAQVRSNCGIQAAEQWGLIEHVTEPDYVKCFRYFGRELCGYGCASSNFESGGCGNINSSHCMGDDYQGFRCSCDGKRYPNNMRYYMPGVRYSRCDSGCQAHKALMGKRPRCCRFRNHCSEPASQPRSYRRYTYAPHWDTGDNCIKCVKGFCPDQPI